MRSPRDSDATGRQYLRNRTNGAQLFSMQVAIAYLRRELGKLRRIIHGGGATGSGVGMRFRGYFSPSAAPDGLGPYLKQDVVLFAPDGLPTGTFIALQNVAAGISPDVGSPNWVALPNSGSMSWL